MKITRTEEDLAEIRAILLKMQSDSSYITKSAYRANADIWPDHRISFIDTHLAYLKAHPQVNPDHYISNLRLKLKKTPNFRN